MIQTQNLDYLIPADSSLNQLINGGASRCVSIRREEEGACSWDRVFCSSNPLVVQPDTPGVHCDKCRKKKCAEEWISPIGEICFILIFKVQEVFLSCFIIGNIIFTCTCTVTIISLFFTFFSAKFFLYYIRHCSQMTIVFYPFSFYFHSFAFSCLLLLSLSTFLYLRQSYFLSLYSFFNLSIYLSFLFFNPCFAPISLPPESSFIER